ncbi:leucyl aminopeptidase [Arsenicitalea aurantiaca]|uniref:Probable cytosol aminopeptidase n=1 Tax=Arsenicitalea aurantiaca TaxID=1783274 RepID=A0A433X386_9HYPH|nr:leucyl aminopeptidase [Arsenicitalea aurantiaca]RUT28526.1 leucyl aminopeptidase [Arsenicitalea aurantiaca]
MPRELVIKTAPMPARPTGTLVIYAAEGAAPADGGTAVWAATGLDWAEVSEAAGFKGKQGQALDIVKPAGLEASRLLVLGSGMTNGDAPASATAWADRGGSLMGKLLALKAEAAAVVLDGIDATPQLVAELAAGLRLRHYRFDRYKTKPKDDNGGPDSLTITLHVSDPAAADAAIAERGAVVEGTLLARELVNEPPNVLGPVEFAERAGRLADLGVEIEILKPSDLEKLGMGALLAVARGSHRPARLVVMQWQGGKKKEAPIAFVGKGVVFDSGGISIKPAGSMEDMKGDMAGAAAVTGLMHALAARKARVNAVGIIGLVENMPDGNAMRPGDILTAMSGRTIEVVNTDAEGRLVLADALWYAQDRFKPKAMINLATLTGAILVALGQDHAGLFSNDNDLSERLAKAGLASGEKVWRMPMGPAYEKMIESRFADIKNTGGRHAGSITAAQFLKHFVNDVPWAHLDIAGAGMATNSNEINVSWAPGFGVALLDRLVRDNYEA